MRHSIFTVLTLAVLSPAAWAAGALPVSVTIEPQRFFVERIGGEHVDVSVMVKPGHAPETFEPSPRQVAVLDSARIYFAIGVPFEQSWMERLPGINPGLLVVDCCSSGAAASRGGAHDHRDPHVWVSPAEAAGFAERVRDGLIRADPGNGDAYRRNHDELRDELAQLHARIEAMLAQPRTRYFIISHASLGYFAQTYGLEQVALEDAGRDAGPRRLTEIARLAEREGIRTILVQRQFNAAPARSLAREIDAQLVEVDPLSGDYMESVTHIAEVVAAATR